MTEDSRLEALRKVPLFSGLTDIELETLLEHSEERAYRPGQDLVTQGDSSGPFFLLYEGRCQVTVNGRPKRKVGPGQYFGDMALIDGEPRSATVRAETEVRGLAIHAEAFFGILEGNFAVTRKIMANLSRRARAAERELHD
ncbi:MAG TPA: cyclic nucleotide-binding domain-containing protein [Acidimicrobiales bacterium]|nr:cyclic nucleotide-binding domain-containing protein [Acidimicrobiales bacterium]